MSKPDDIVWLYKVYETKDMSAEVLQKHLDDWSNSVMPHELIPQGDKLIVRYQSALTREAYFKQQLASMDITKNTLENAAR